MKTYDFAVVGAGVFGAWTAHFLQQSGASVALLDAYGPANSRASSSGETRVIRMGYGPDELYTRWAMRSLPMWRDFAARTGREIFRQTGVLWLSNDADAYLKSLCSVLAKAGVEREELTAKEIALHWPQLRFHDVTWGVLEPQSGLLLAREAVQTLVKELWGMAWHTFRFLPLRLQAERASWRRFRAAQANQFLRERSFFVAGRGCPRFFLSYWVIGYFQRGRKYFFWEHRRVARIFDRPGCRCGCIVRIQDCLTHYLILRDADLRSLLTSTVSASIPIQVRVW